MEEKIPFFSRSVAKRFPHERVKRFFFAQSQGKTYEYQVVIDTAKGQYEELLDEVMAQWRIRSELSPEVQARSFARAAAIITGELVFMDEIRTVDGDGCYRRVWLIVCRHGEVMPRVLCGNTRGSRHPGFIKRL